MTSSALPLLLVFPFGYLSHYLRSLELCRHLNRHFEIRFAHHDKYGRFVQQDGYTTFQVSAFDEDAVLSLIRKFDFSWLNEQQLERTFLAQAAVIREYRPAAVLGDAMPTLKMAAAYAGVPFIALTNGYMSKYYAAARELSRTHPAYPFLRAFPGSLRHLMTVKGEALAMRSVHKPFRKLRSKYGLPALDTYLDELEGDYTLICDLTQLFPQKVLPPHYTVIGPLLYGAYQGTSCSAQLIFGKQTIFVSMGSTGDWYSLAFLNEPYYNRYNIVTAGDGHGVLNAPHMIRADFIDADDILPHADLVICHGGNGTIYQALSYGVPLLCMPAHFEQEWNVAAITRAELAGSLDNTRRTDTAALIDKWLARKGQPVYTDIQTSIKAAQSAIPKKIANLSSAICVNTMDG